MLSLFRHLTRVGSAYRSSSKRTSVAKALRPDYQSLEPRRMLAADFSNQPPTFDTVFPPPETVEVGVGHLRHIHVVDLNRDGFQDIVTSGSLDKSFSVTLAQSNTSFDEPTIYAVGDRAIGSGMGDVNGDGNLDMVITLYDLNQVGLYLGQGDGSFLHGGDYSAPGGPFHLTVTDLNHDGFADVAVALANADQLGILTATGDGGLNPIETQSIGDVPDLVEPADLNHDGWMDLVVEIRGGSRVAVLLGNGSGTFSSTDYYYTGDSPRGLVVADLNHDGHLDLATANYLSSDIGVALGRGDGTFDQATRWSTHSQAEDIATADFDGDGHRDLFVTQTSTEVMFFRGDGLGGFEWEQSFHLPRPAHTDFPMTTADLNNDSRDDLLVRGDAGEVLVYLNQSMWIDENSSGERFDITGISSGESGNQPVELTVASSDADLLSAKIISSPTLEGTLAEGLFAHYSLDNTAEDSSGNNRHGTMSDPDLITPSTDRFGNPNSAFEIQPRASIDVVPEDSLFPYQNSGIVTYSLWLKATSNTTTLNQYDHLNPTNSHFYLAIHPDVVTFTGNGTNAFRPSYESALNQWHHYAISVDGSSGDVRIWADGNDLGVGNINLNPSSTASKPFRIGFLPNAANNPGESKLYLDDVSVYNRELTEDEITALRMRSSVEVVPIECKTGHATVTVTAEDGGDDNDLATAEDNLTFSRVIDVEILPVPYGPMVDPADVTYVYPLDYGPAGPNQGDSAQPRSDHRFYGDATGNTLSNGVIAESFPLDSDPDIYVVGFNEYAGSNTGTDTGTPQPRIEFDLAGPRNLEAISVSYFAGGHSAVVGPQSVEVFFSFDGGVTFSSTPDIVYSQFDTTQEVATLISVTDHITFDEVEGVTDVRADFYQGDYELKTNTSAWVFLSEINFYERCAYSQPPTLDAIDDLAINEDASEQSIGLTGITAGGGESQNLRVTASSGNNALVPTPTVSMPAWLVEPSYHVWE